MTETSTAAPESASVVFEQVLLYTGVDGKARFAHVPLSLTNGTPAARLSDWLPVEGLQLRQSPVGFSSAFHCTGQPQWLLVLQGEMEIGLQDGSHRRFKAGQHFISADVLPQGETFNPQRHGHCSRQVGDEPLVTAFVRLPADWVCPLA